MNKGLNITIYDDSGQSRIANDINANTGTIVTAEMEQGTANISTSTRDIKASDYGIIDIGIKLFDDSQSLENKINSCILRIYIYKSELTTSRNFLSTTYNADYKQLTQELNEYQELLKNETSVNLQDAIKDLILYVKDLLYDLEEDKIFHTERIRTHTVLILQYTEFLQDLRLYGNLKTELVLEQVGDTTEEQEEFNVEDFSEADIYQAPGMNISAGITDAVASYLEVTVLSLIAGGASNLMLTLGINQETLGIANQIINMMNNSILSINNIISFIPKNIYMTPSPKTALSSITTSLKDMYVAMYTSLENKYYETINEAITNLPSAQEALRDAQETLLSIIMSMIDEQCIKYTGYTLVELQFMCSSYIAKYKEWQRARKQKKEDEEETEEDINVSGLKTNHKISVNVDSDAIKQQFFEELAAASDLIYNAFFIILIKESVNEIRNIISSFNNVDLNVLADGINSLDDFIKMMDELGIGTDGAIITLEESIKYGINAFAGNVNNIRDYMMELAISSGVNIMSSAIDNTHISYSKNQQKTFDFNTNIDTGEIMLNIYTDPTIKKVNKDITNVLRNTKKHQGDNLFTANDMVTILKNINDGYIYNEDKTIEFVDFTLKIHFDISNGIDKNQEGYEQAELLNKTLLENYLLNKDDDRYNYELGVITEEYTKDPTLAVKRPTFALIHELYSVLSEVFPLLKTFAILVLNYKINKAKVAGYNEGNLNAMIASIAKVNNLFKKTNKRHLNFYTVRTLLLYNFIKENITKPGPNLDIKLTTELTIQLYTYLKTQNMNYNTLNKDFDTILYIDMDSIQDLQKYIEDLQKDLNKFFGDDSSLFIKYTTPKYYDGDISALDKIEVAGDTIYYSDSSLPLYGSQILNCISKGYDVSI